ncbi:hypothetical protein, partial [Methylobacterium sp. WL93]|uniref:hypothetical protein n=1 Tax=Methylobacterium sp. WL93 TaxID=2603892 RepID=UPI001AEDCFA6
IQKFFNVYRRLGVDFGALFPFFWGVVSGFWGVTSGFLGRAFTYPQRVLWLGLSGLLGRSFRDSWRADGSLHTVSYEPSSQVFFAKRFGDFEA